MKFVAIAALLATASAVKISSLNKSSQPEPPTWEQVLKELDADASGTVSWDELSDFFKKIAKEHDYKLTKEDLEQAKEIFKMIDTDGSDDIDKKEFEAAMEAAGALGQKSRKMFAQVREDPPTWEDVEEVAEDDVGQPTVEDVEHVIDEIEQEID